MNDNDIEQEIQAKGLTAPRVTPADIEANIASEHYFTAADGFRLQWLTADHEKHDDRVAVYSVTSNMPVRGYGGNCASIDANAGTPQPLGLLTFCVLVLKNGFTVTGESACASPENFDAELGRKIARQNAVQKLWPLMGYELKQRLFEQARGDVNQYEVEQNEARLTLVRAIADELDLPKSVTCDEMLKAVVDLKKGVL